MVVYKINTKKYPSDIPITTRKNNGNKLSSLAMKMHTFPKYNMRKLAIRF